MSDDGKWTTYKEDKRPAKGGWAPGAYLAKCIRCKTYFIGDKRALHCADCAYHTKPEET